MSLPMCCPGLSKLSWLRQLSLLLIVLAAAPQRGWGQAPPPDDLALLWDNVYRVAGEAESASPGVSLIEKWWELDDEFNWKRVPGEVRTYSALPWPISNGWYCEYDQTVLGNGNGLFKPLLVYDPGRVTLDQLSLNLANCAVQGVFARKFNDYRAAFHYNMDPETGIADMREWQRRQFQQAAFAGEVGFYVVLGYYQLFMPGAVDLIQIVFELVDAFNHGQSLRNAAVAFNVGVFAFSVARFMPVAKQMIYKFKPLGTGPHLEVLGSDIVEMRTLERILLRNPPPGVNAEQVAFHAYSMMSEPFKRAMKRALGLSDIVFGPLKRNVHGLYSPERRIIVISDRYANNVSMQFFALSHELMHAMQYRVIEGLTRLPDSLAWKSAEESLFEVFAYAQSADLFQRTLGDTKLMQAVSFDINRALSETLANYRTMHNTLYSWIGCIRGGKFPHTPEFKAVFKRIYEYHGPELFYTRLHTNFTTEAQKELYDWAMANML